MSRWAYLAVLIVVLASVGFGLDWQPAVMSPMPDSKFAVPAPSPVPRNKTDGPNAALSPVYPASPGPPGAVPDQTVGSGVAQRPSQVRGPLAAEVAAPNCNVRACTAAYRSFVAADCSYQPLNGPRRRCEKR